MWVDPLELRSFIKRNLASEQRQAVFWSRLSGECQYHAPRASEGELRQADAAEATSCLNIFEAARKGLEGAVRHYLREDPTCVRDSSGGRVGGQRWL